MNRKVVELVLIVAVLVGIFCMLTCIVTATEFDSPLESPLPVPTHTIYYLTDSDGERCLPGRPRPAPFGP